METSLKSAGDGIAPGSAKQTGNRTSTVRRNRVGVGPGVARVQAYADTNGVPPARSPAVNALFNQLYGLADRAEAPLCDELGRCIDSLQGAVVAEQEGLSSTGPAVSQVAQLASDVPSRDKGLGCLFFEVAALASQVESLLHGALQLTADDAGANAIAAGAELVAKMGWLADLGSDRLDAVQVRGGVDQWLLAPTTREAVFGGRA